MTEEDWQRWERERMVPAIDPGDGSDLLKDALDAAGIFAQEKEPNWPIAERDFLKYGLLVRDCAFYQRWPGRDGKYGIGIGSPQYAERLDYGRYTFEQIVAIAKQRHTGKCPVTCTIAELWEIKNGPK